MIYHGLMPISVALLYGWAINRGARWCGRQTMREAILSLSLGRRSDTFRRMRTYNIWVAVSLPLVLIVLFLLH